MIEGPGRFAKLSGRLVGKQAGISISNGKARDLLWANRRFKIHYNQNGNEDEKAAGGTTSKGHGAKDDSDGNTNLSWQHGVLSSEQHLVLSTRLDKFKVGFTGAISRAGGRNGLRGRLRHAATPYGSYSCREVTLGLP